MVDCLIEIEQFKLAHDVTLAMLRSRQCQDRTYIQYDIICEALKQKPEPEFVLEKGLKE